MRAPRPGTHSWATGTGMPVYQGFGPRVRVVRATDPARPAIHRFYDSSPLSPSGRLLAVTELPFEDRLPAPADLARVAVIDVQNGRRVFEFSTTAWDTQVGAHVQWGSDDRTLLFNHRTAVDAPPRAVVVDPLTGSERVLDGAVMAASPDGTTCLSPDLAKLSLVQAGYGVRVPEPEALRHRGAPEDDGVFATDVGSGRRRLLVSFAELIASLPDAFDDVDAGRGGVYGFLVKWHPRGDRILVILRWLGEGRIGGTTRNALVAIDPDGGRPRLVVSSRRWGGGHHPTWWPDRHEVVMNLGFDRWPRWAVRVGRRAARVARRAGWRLPEPGRLRFARIPVDAGGDPQKMVPARVGSGHPSIHPSGRVLVTDAYPYEPVAFGDGTVPIRWIDLASGDETTIVRIRTRPNYEGPAAQLRVDPHPAWSRDGRTLAFNACPDGVRGVFLADVGPLLDEGAPA